MEHKKGKNTLFSCLMSRFVRCRAAYLSFFIAQFIWYCAKWKEWKANNLYFYVVCGNIFVYLPSVINLKTV